MALLGKIVDFGLTPIRWTVCIASIPIFMAACLAQGICDICDTQKRNICIECIKYKIDTSNNYVKYDDIPYWFKPNYSYYNSYKDKIAVIVNDRMYFAHKYINKQTNKIVYVTNNGKTVVDSNLEQYKIGM